MKIYPNNVNYTPRNKHKEEVKETIIKIPESPEFRALTQKVVGPIPDNLPVPKISGEPKVENPRPPLHIEPAKPEQPILSNSEIDKVINKVRRNGVMKRAIKFGIVGLGQGGCRIAGEFEKLGYATLAINSSEQDLNESPCKERLLLGGSGAGKDLKTGAGIINTFRNKIMTAYQTALPGIEHAIVCAGSSGGTGGGGLINIIDTLRDYKVPVGVITTLPLNTEDTRAKKNTLSVINELVKMNAEGKISPLILVDNNKIEKKYPGLSTLVFWNRANEDVVKCFDLFNMLAARTSAYTSFDPADYKRVLTSGGCMIFGNMAIEGDIQSDTISNAIQNNIDGGLLAEGFNLVEATSAAFIMVGNPDQMTKLPRSSEENANAMLMRLLGSGTIFRGVYALPSVTSFEIFFMISGLGLPVQKIKEMIKSSHEESAHLQKKTTLRTVDDVMNELEGETGKGA
jgi:cell division GTPase FtsZ